MIRILQDWEKGRNRWPSMYKTGIFLYWVAELRFDQRGIPSEGGPQAVPCDKYSAETSWSTWGLEYDFEKIAPQIPEAPAPHAYRRLNKYYNLFYVPVSIERSYLAVALYLLRNAKSAEDCEDGNEEHLQAMRRFVYYLWTQREDKEEILECIAQIHEHAMADHEISERKKEHFDGLFNALATYARQDPAHQQRLRTAFDQIRMV